MYPISSKYSKYQYIRVKYNLTVLYSSDKQLPLVHPNQVKYSTVSISQYSKYPSNNPSSKLYTYVLSHHHYNHSWRVGSSIYPDISKPTQSISHLYPFILTFITYKVYINNSFHKSLGSEHITPKSSPKVPILS